MAQRFRKVKRKVLAGPDKGKVKTYAMAKSSGIFGFEDMCKLISSRASVSSADVKAVLDSLTWGMDFALQLGLTVQLGEFGNFHLTVSSEGTEEEKDFDASKITKTRIAFYPGARLQKTRKEVDFVSESVEEGSKPEEGGNNEGDDIL